MRALSRWCKRRYAALRIGRRQREINTLIDQHLNLSTTLCPAGARGRDSIYQVLDGQHVVAMLRLVNPYLHRKPLPDDSPFVTLPDDQRLAREWRCYQRGFGAKLTPEPLWKSNDALLCAHVSGERLSDSLSRSPTLLWQLLGEATSRLAELHRAGIVHMDSSLANIIKPAITGQPIFIDFEYAPAPQLSLAQQHAYDYLRLAESSIKFMPPACEHDYHHWIAALDKYVDNASRQCDITPLKPALGRVLKPAPWYDALAEIFTGLQTEAFKKSVLTPQCD